MKYPTVILADGSFPLHGIPLGYIRNAERIVCCDGSTGSLVDSGFEPYAITGDMDSLSPDLARRFSGRLYPDSDQETNDLTKAVRWCSQRGFNDLAIVGATGRREDHTIGNISLLAEYVKLVNVIMVTDTGIFMPVDRSSRIDTFPGQQISVFSIFPDTEITCEGLKYPLDKRKLLNWWQGTLNEASGNELYLHFTSGCLILFLKFRE